MIVIEDDVWVGFGSIILSGVRVAQGSIIAAGSVVTKDVEAFCIYGGVPAKKIGLRFNNKEDLHNHIEKYNLQYKNEL
jgi:acetyltransferase-like isoleucine patch superfamily enzyme